MSPLTAVIVPPVREAAVEFVIDHCRLTPVPLAVAQSGPLPPNAAGIMGAITFHGLPAWRFLLVLPADAAVALARAFTGADIPFDAPDMADAVGEIANVIAGDIAARLDRRGVPARISLPTVVRGPDVATLAPADARAVWLRFESPAGTHWYKLAKAPLARPAGGAR